MDELKGQQKKQKELCVMGFGFGIFIFSRPSHHNKQRNTMNRTV